MGLPLANAAVACALTGLIWTIQVVHYPLFARVGEAEWPAYEREHQRRITLVVAPLMLANAGLALALVLGAPTALRWANLALAAACSPRPCSSTRPGTGAWRRRTTAPRSTASSR